MLAKRFAAVLLTLYKLRTLLAVREGSTDLISCILFYEISQKLLGNSWNFWGFPLVSPSLIFSHSKLGIPFTSGQKGIPNMGDVPMEAAILAHVHPLGLSFKPGGGQALPLPTVNLPTLYSLLHMSALEIHRQLN